MKNLYLVRHAKSSWDAPELKDIERPLLPKGIKRTKRIVEYLKSKGVSVDVIVSSPAIRAHETAKLIAKDIGYGVSDIKIDQDIYFGDTDEFFNALYQLDNNIDSVMIFGHNPTITQFANYFLHDKIDNLPTSGVVNIIFETENWTEIPKCKWKVGFAISPKMLKE